MKLHALLRPAGILVKAPHSERDVTDVACDSRRVRPGTLFVALKGQTHDGLAFVDDAVERGAVAVVSSQPLKVRGGIHVVTAPDTRAAYAITSAVLHGYPSRGMQVCGITGTNGKTTVAFMLREMLRKADARPGMIGTVQYEIGSRSIPALRTTPDAGEIQQLLAQMVQAGCRSAVIEASSHAADQKRVWSVEFDVGVFTNLTRDHLDYHGSMENYYQAKRTFFLRLAGHEKPAVAVLNADDAAGRRLAEDADIRVAKLTYGKAANADVRILDVVTDIAGSRMTVASPWGQCRLRIKLLGHYNVCNALAAFTAGGALGLDPAVMASALRTMAAVPGRLEEIACDNEFRVFVDYAHTDDALENVLATLRPLTRGRLIAVFGCGGNRDRSKRRAMGAAADAGADIAVVTSDNPRKEEPEVIIRDILAGFSRERSPLVAVDRREAIREALALARKDDVILIAGKGHETFQEFAHTVVPFDDREVVRSILGVERSATQRKAVSR